MSPAYRAHPEFGYLCPSRGFRRTMWAALAVAAFGTLAGAFVLSSGHDARDDRAVLIAPVNAAPSGVEAMPTAEPAPAAATAAGPRSPERGKAACEGDTWTYLDGKCIAGRAHRARSAAAIDSPPIAAIPLGRSTPPLPAAAPAPAEPARATEAAVPAPAEPEQAADAAEAAPEAAAPAEQSTSVPKERRKVSRSRSGGRDLAKVNGSSRVGRSRDDRRRARAYPSLDERDRQMSMPKSAMSWAKQLRGCVEAARCPAGEELMRALLPSGI